MSISDWRVVEKIRRKLEKVLVLSNFCWNLKKKKLVEYSEKRHGNFENLWENVLNLSKLWIKFVKILLRTYWNFVSAFQKILEMLNNLMKFRLRIGYRNGAWRRNQAARTRGGMDWGRSRVQLKCDWREVWLNVHARTWTENTHAKCGSDESIRVSVGPRKWWRSTLE